MRSSNANGHRFARPRVLVTALVASITASTATTAYADDSESFFAQGRALRADNKCAEAIVAFRRALELRPQGLGSLRNIAECEEALGQFASARTDYWNLRRAVLQSNEPKYQGWDKDAEEAYHRLDGKVAHLTVRLTGVEPSRARVTVDGKPLDPRLYDVELERDLGPHVVEASYDGAAPLVERRTLEAGAHEVVTLVIAAPAAEVAPAPAPPPVDTTRPRLRIAGFASLAVGGASLVGLAAAAGVRQSALSSFAVCAPSYVECPTSLRGEQSKGQTASALVTTFGVLAALGVGVGVPLVVLGFRKNAPAPSTALSIVPTPGGAGLGAAGRFW